MRGKHRKNLGNRDSARPAVPQVAPPDALPTRAGKNGIWPMLFACLVFALLYVHLAWVVEPRLIYYAQRIPLRSGQSLTLPFFAKGATFFQDFCGRPGGLVQYTAAWVCQYYYFRCLGPLILTAVAWSIFFFGARLNRRLGAAKNGMTCYVPLLLLLVIYNHYVFGLEDLLALGAVLASVDLYALVAGRTKTWVGILVFAAVSILLFVVVGGPSLLFPVLCAAVELAWRRYLLGTLYLLAGSAIPWIGVFAFRLEAADAYGWLRAILSAHSTHKPMAIVLLYLFFPALCIAAPARRFAARVAAAWLPRLITRTKTFFASRWVGVTAAILLLTAGAWLARQTLDTDTRTRLRVNCFCRQGMWQDCLDELRQASDVEYTALLLCDVNRAPFETGQLPSAMFSFPQKPGVLFARGTDGVYLEGSCEVLLRLGCVNEAEHVASESMEIVGPRPRVLRQLAQIYIAKGCPEAAKVFLGAMRNDVIEGPWAEACLTRLEQDPALSGDEEINHLRSVMFPQDAMDTTRSDERMLLAMMEQNKNNRMAFEYLMAHYLLNAEPEKLVAQIGRLKDFDYADIPALYAEAAAFYAHNMAQPADAGGRSIPAEAVRRIERAVQIASDARGDRQKLVAKLAAELPTSVARYFITGQSGIAK